MKRFPHLDLQPKQLSPLFYPLLDRRFSARLVIQGSDDAVNGALNFYSLPSMLVGMTTFLEKSLTICLLRNQFHYLTLITLLSIYVTFYHSLKSSNVVLPRDERILVSSAIAYYLSRFVGVLSNRDETTRHHLILNLADFYVFTCCWYSQNIIPFQQCLETFPHSFSIQNICVFRAKYFSALTLQNSLQIVSSSLPARDIFTNFHKIFCKINVAAFKYKSLFGFGNAGVLAKTDTF